MKSMDQIVVIDNGERIENGGHDALMKNNGLYSKLYSMQKDNYG